MIATDEPKAGKAFNEWTGVFSERLFFVIQIYMDESGTDGRGTSTVCGWIAVPDYWKRFNKRWGKVLSKNDAPYFHFKEFADKNNRYKIPSNPFLAWGEEKRDKLLFSLAFLLSQFPSDAIPVGGAASEKRIAELAPEKSVFEETLRAFYRGTIQALNRHWSGYAGKVLFIYDKCQNPNILVPLHKIHNEFSKIDSRFGGLTFEDDKDPMHYGLQAADLSAYRDRQRAEDVFKHGIIPPQRTLDFILNRNLKIRSGGLDNQNWERLVRLIRADEKKKKSLWAKEGVEQIYYPEKHFQFEEHGYSATGWETEAI